jgi:hypothetical protein
MMKHVGLPFLLHDSESDSSSRRMTVGGEGVNIAQRGKNVHKTVIESGEVLEDIEESDPPENQEGAETPHHSKNDQNVKAEGPM